MSQLTAQLRDTYCLGVGGDLTRGPPKQAPSARCVFILLPRTLTS